MKHFVSIKTKLITNTMAIIFVIFVVVLSFIIFRSLQTVGKSIKKSEQYIRSSLIAKGNTLIKNNSIAITGMVKENSFTAIQELVSSIVKDDDDIIYGIYMDSNRRAWANASIANPAGIPNDNNPLNDFVSQWADSLKNSNHTFYTFCNNEIIEFAAPIRIDNDVYGHIRYGISTASMNRSLSESLQDGLHRRNVTLIVLLLVGIISLCSSYIIIKRQATRITRPIASLVESTKAIAEGNYNISVSSDSNDELGLLVLDVEKMRKAIKTLTEDLGSKIKELKHTEQIVRKSEEKYRRLFEESKDGIIIYDFNGGLLEANRHTYQMLGYEPSELESVGFSNLYKDNTLVDSSCLLKIIKAKGSLHFESKHKKADDTTINIEVSSTVIDEERGIIRFILRDITEKKRLEEQFHQSQKMEAVGRIAGGIAHDFNNILQIIIGFSELLLNDFMIQEPYRESVEEIRKAALKGASLINQLLAFSRKQIISPRLINLNDEIVEMVRMIKRLIGEDIELETILSPELNIVKVDKGRIEQVILNLVINARDAMQKGGRLTIKTENIRLSQEDSLKIPDAHPGSYACLSIKDTGIGMDKETMAQIFEPFFTTKGKSKGTGLGLSMVYGIIKQHGGWINIESNPGEGTTFKIYLAALSDKADEITKEPDSAPAVVLSDVKGHGERILLVEDEKGLRQFVAKILRSKGYKVSDAASAQEAIEIFQKEKGEFQLILSDVVLPDINGIQLVERFQKINPGIKIILSSGYTGERSQRELIQEKGLKYIQKPYHLQDFLKTIKDVLTH